MSIRILRAADHRRMPWKNGRGETVEVAIHPAAAGLEDFGWRVSMAGVAEDGDFSIFPGIDRTLAVLSGDGIDLDIAGHACQRLTQDAAPLSFPADLPCSARLVRGPITDLNVMTRRGMFSHRLTRGVAGAPCDLRLILAMAPAIVRLAGRDYPMQALDALCCDGPDAAQPFLPSKGVWLIEIDKL